MTDVFAGVTQIQRFTASVYKGRPLYLHNFDKKPGEVNGDNEGNLWHSVK